MTYLKSVSGYLPDNIVSNQYLSQFMDTSDEWIQARSGIKERRWLRKGNQVFRGMTNHEMVFNAAKEAINKAQLSLSDIDLIFYATITPDNEMPGSGVYLKKLLGMDQSVPVYEIRNQCSGFLYALQAARAFIENQRSANVLVVGAEIQSSGLDLSTSGRNTAVLFADGAGVAVLSGQSEDAHKLLALKLHSDGTFADKLGIKYPGYCRREIIRPADFDSASGEIYPYMDGKFVFKMASIKMPEIINEILSENNYKLEQLKLVIPHQANLRIIQMISASFGDKVKVFSNIQHYGNTTAASIPLALTEAEEQGMMQKGDLICLVSFGAGFSWGAALILW